MNHEKTILCERRAALEAALPGAIRHLAAIEGGLAEIDLIEQQAVAREQEAAGAALVGNTYPCRGMDALAAAAGTE